jgi:hypothetical protein
VEAIGRSHTPVIAPHGRAALEIIHMKRLTLGLGLLGLLFLNVAATSQKNSEETAVRATVTDYIEAYYTGDAARMEQSLHPHYMKHTISESDGKLRMTETSGLQMVQDIRSGAADLPASERKEEITVFDVTGDIASAKLITSHWTDYLTLTKWNGQWKIVSVVLRDDN